MWCSSCGQNMVYHSSGACKTCHKDLQGQVKFLAQQLEAANQAIIRMEAEKIQLKNEQKEEHNG